ncbi:MAG: TolC family protein [Gemmatimonadales bacterium]|nr:TolC family protein [Gemmatimonadales bacterium]
MAGRIFAAALAWLAVGTAVARAQVPTVTLQEAVEMARHVNPTIISAEGQVQNAGAGKLQAMGAWLPSLSASSGYNVRPGQERLDPTTGAYVTPTSRSASGSIGASLELFNGFRRIAENRSANAEQSNAQASLVNQEFQIALQTKQAFFNALASDELVRVSERRIQRAEEQLRMSRDKLAAGSAIRSDTLQSVVELGSARLQLLQAQTARATAEANLARLIGVDGSVGAAADSNLLQPVVLDTVQLRMEAVAQAPSVIQADAAVRVAEASVAVSRAAYFPSLTASYNRSLSGSPGAVTALDTLPGWDWRGTWSASLGLRWTLFNGFSREAGVTRSTTSRNTARAQADDARRAVQANLTQYLASLASAEQSVTIAQASVAAATEGLRVQQERYGLGMATIVDVLTAQISLDQAEVDIVRARFDYLVAKAQIEALIGREL